ncbi:cellulase family glycosylhydrolase [Erwinia sp. S38]|uniref:cellulase family glycosylhydrolase n=1 Tax=Erwinia sp. S38 TaxID=2769338 RepID=UPI00190C201A|nr:cellulase family glycosylhydrolase [Erwinia sp. S38]MBK0002090.1 cellulase family glycosylhydrolase [Erwinia sp. S38]
MYKKYIKNFFLATAISCGMYHADLLALEIGVTTHVRNYTSNPADTIKLLNEYGFSSYREDFPWSRVERSAGVYDLDHSLSILDEFISESVKNKISPLLILNYGNKIHTNRNYPVTDEQIDAFANYAFWVASKYKGKIKYYEIWNEWLVKSGVPKNNNVPSSDVYLNLVRKTSEKIRKADPNAKIITGSMNPLVPKDRTWMKSLVKKGILNYVDGVSIHPYSYMFPDKSLNTPTKNLGKIDYFEKELVSIHGKEVPIYITEYGYPNNIGGNGLSETQSSNMMIQYTLLAKQRNYIKGIWWYDFINDGQSAIEKEHNFGFLTNELKPKVSAVKFKELYKSGLMHSTVEEVSSDLNLKSSSKAVIENRKFILNDGSKKVIITCPISFYADTSCEIH